MMQVDINVSEIYNIWFQKHGVTDHQSSQSEQWTLLLVIKRTTEAARRLLHTKCRLTKDLRKARQLSDSLCL